jgi:endonuclease YncB( thermonuclease family)
LYLPTLVVASGLLQGEIVAVADGDTLTLLDAQGQRQRVRLAVIDAPERDQAYGKASGMALSQLCLGIEAHVRVDTLDRFGRTVGTGFCACIEAHAEHVMRGLAWVYARYAPANSPLFALQDEARTARRGLWADGDAIAPWDWRRGLRAVEHDQREPTTYN